MAGGETFNLAEEFAGVDFNDERLEKRFRRAMEMLARQPGKSVYDSQQKMEGNGYIGDKTDGGKYSQLSCGDAGGISSGPAGPDGLQRPDTGENPASQ
ncbi:MAG: transposase [Spirochaetaceae bacterium]|jgi:hypothetical protein|nr:transposase [Spirochaetaceae bacterium]